MVYSSHLLCHQTFSGLVLKYWHPRRLLLQMVRIFTKSFHSAHGHSARQTKCKSTSFETTSTGSGKGGQRERIC